MAKNLVIVESPAKAKTIEKFLGKDYHLASSYGHISDLPSKEIGVDVDKNFKPKYIVSKDKKDVVNKLKKLAKSSEMVWLASDEDREGEAIAWHLSEALQLKPENTKRIVFHEITKKAILKAVENPRDIDYDMVNAQQARRVLDRLVGYELSPVLWRKVKGGLSAGRVQSVAVRLIVERERSILEFNAETHYKVVAEFKNDEGKKFKAVQTGGPSGGCLTEDYLDLPIDYDSLLEAGTMMGSGGMVVMDEDSCMVDVARFFLNFTESESCGKCTPCREGTKRMLEILNRLCDGKGKEGDIQLLEELANHIKDTALCGLGQSAPNPVLSTLQYFRDEYEAHIYDKKCPAGVCPGMTSAYVIDGDTCIGCGMCAKECPVDAISGKSKEVYEIDPDKCISCGACEDVCPVDAISQG